MSTKALEIIKCTKCPHLVFPGEDLFAISGSSICSTCAGKKVKIPA